METITADMLAQKTFYNSVLNTVVNTMGTTARTHGPPQGHGFLGKF